MELLTYAPPSTGRTAVGMWRLSANTVRLSALPSPFVSSSMRMRSFSLAPGLMCGYMPLETIQRRPFESKFI